MDRPTDEFWRPFYERCLLETYKHINFYNRLIYHDRRISRPGWSTCSRQTDRWILTPGWSTSQYSATLHNCLFAWLINLTVIWCLFSIYIYKHKCDVLLWSHEFVYVNCRIDSHNFGFWKTINPFHLSLTWMNRFAQHSHKIPFISLAMLQLRRVRVKYKNWQFIENINFHRNVWILLE